MRTIVIVYLNELLDCVLNYIFFKGIFMLELFLELVCY